MHDVQLLKKIEGLEQRLSVLEGNYSYEWSVPRRAPSSVWEKTRGILSSRREAALLQKIKAGRKQWASAHPLSLT